jgi:hypothetical protein
LDSSLPTFSSLLAFLRTCLQQSFPVLGFQAATHPSTTSFLCPIPKPELLAGHVATEAADALPPLKVMQREVNELVITKLLPRLEVSGTRLGSADGFPQPHSDEVIVLLPFFVRGLGFPWCNFLHHLLSFLPNRVSSPKSQLGFANCGFHSPLRSFPWHPPFPRPFPPSVLGETATFCGQPSCDSGCGNPASRQ